MNFPLTRGRFSISTIGEGEKLDLVIELSRSHNENNEESEHRPIHDSIILQPSRVLTGISDKHDKDPSQNEEQYMKKINLEQFEAPVLNDECLKLFHFLVNSKYIEMINFHKEEMLNYIERDTERQMKIMKLLDEISRFTKANFFLEQENNKLRKLIIEKGKT